MSADSSADRSLDGQTGPMRLDAALVAPGDLPYAPQVVVSDVSFISLSHVIPPVARLAAPGAHVILLVKPQFEVGRARLGKNGIVTDPAARRQALADVTACAEANGLRVVTSAPAPSKAPTATWSTCCTPAPPERRRRGRRLTAA